MLENFGGDNAIARLLLPEPDDFYTLKPKHSAFYLMPLDLILEQPGTEILIVIGVSTDICILFTANETYIRDYKLIIKISKCFLNLPKI